MSDAAAAALARYQRWAETWQPVREAWLDEYVVTLRPSYRDGSRAVLEAFTTKGFDTSGVQWEAMTLPELGQRAGVSRDAAKRVISKATRDGWLTSVGAQPNGHGKRPSPLYALTRPGEGAWWLTDAA